MDKRCQAIRSARGIGNHMVSGLIIVCVVHTHHKGLQGTLTWSRDDDLLCSSSDVALCLLSIYEEAGRLYDEVNAHCTPWKLFKAFSACRDALNLVPIDNQCVCTLCGHF